jgi:preprotein translocase subunit SecA
MRLGVIYAGREYLISHEDVEFTAEDFIVEVYNSFVNTYYNSIELGKRSLTTGLGFNAKAYFAAGYGTGHENIEYALQIKGI